MAAMTRNCRIWEKNKYWKEFESYRHQFFKIMVGDFRDHLRLPRKFMRNFRENLSGTINLRGPSGFMWPVELVRMSDDAVFINGWEIFAKDHRLAEADLLVFRYDGNSTFDVLIFDRSCCEREGSYFVRKHTNACSSDRCLFEKEDEGEDYEEIIDLDKIHENHMQKLKIKKKRGRPSSKAFYTYNPRQSKLPQVGKSQVEKSAVARESMEVSIDESDGASGSAMVAIEEHSKESASLKCKSERKRKNYLPLNPLRGSKMKRPVDLPGTYNLYFISNRRVITEEEKQRPRKLAKQYSSTRPSFTIVMKPSHVSRAFAATIPKKEWRAMHILGDVGRAELRVLPGEKRWEVRIRGSMCGRGWARFVLDNNLEEHDACVFELNDEGKANGKTIVFNVVIFRVLDEIVPLTQISRNTMRLRI